MSDRSRSGEEREDWTFWFDFFGLQIFKMRVNLIREPGQKTEQPSKKALGFPDENGIRLYK